MEKCPIHDESMKGLREDIHEVKECVKRIEKTLHGNGEGLSVQAAKNTEFRLRTEKKQEDEAGNWKRIMPAVIGGVITAVIVGLLMVLFPLMAKGLTLEELWLSGSVRQNADNRTEWELALGSNDNQLGYERMAAAGIMKYGWLYDVRMAKRGTWYKATFTDIYRQINDVSLQSNVLTFGKGIRAGGALVSNHYGDWGLMGAVEVEYEQGWVKVGTTYLTDLSEYRWHVLADLSIPVGNHLSIVPTIKYSGTEDITVGRGKVILKYKFWWNIGNKQKY